MIPLETFGLDSDFNRRFIRTHGINLHVVEAGRGDALLLVSGWPQTWIAWRKIMPALAKQYRVIAVDLPGLGRSDPPVGDSDTASIARHLEPILDAIGAASCQLVGHDVGAWVSYAFATQYPDKVQRLALIDAAIPGLTPPEAYRLSPATMSKTWHFSFNYVPSLSETLVIGREREFLSWLFESKSKDWTEAVDAIALNEYVSSYAEPGRWSAGLAYYRSIFESIAQNQVFCLTPLAMPVLAIGGELGMGSLMASQLGKAASNLQSHVIPNCGHYVPEESPAELLDLLRSFLASHKLS